MEIAYKYVDPEAIFRGSCARRGRDYLYHVAVRQGFRQRFCRVCGAPFQAKRLDALTCTTTCRLRKSRGHDLAYLATLPAAQADARRSVHQAHLDAVATAKAVAASRREGRGQRRKLPQVKAMKIRVAVRTS
jgi:hypothetical protein